MDNKNKIESIHFLVDELERYNRAYYVDCKPLVRDYDYDEMLKIADERMYANKRERKAGRA